MPHLVQPQPEAGEPDAMAISLTPLWNRGYDALHSDAKRVTHCICSYRLLSTECKLSFLCQGIVYLSLFAIVFRGMEVYGLDKSCK